MTKVHLVNDARALAVKMEFDDATPIFPMRAVVLQFPAAHTTDELPIPSAPLSLAVAPHIAKELAHALLRAADDLDRM